MFLSLSYMEEKIMEILEVTGTSYPNARELPCKSGRPIAKHQKSPGGNSRMETHRSGRYMPHASGKLLVEQQKADREATAAGRMVMIIVAGGPRKFIREVDYKAGRF